MNFLSRQRASCAADAQLETAAFKSPFKMTIKFHVSGQPSGADNGGATLFMNRPSSMFLFSKPGTPGRRLTRRLNDERIAMAKIKSQSPAHQWKFLSRAQKARAEVNVK